MLRLAISLYWRWRMTYEVCRFYKPIAAIGENPQVCPVRRFRFSSIAAICKWPISDLPDQIWRLNLPRSASIIARCARSLSTSFISSRSFIRPAMFDLRLSFCVYWWAKHFHFCKRQKINAIWCVLRWPHAKYRGRSFPRKAHVLLWSYTVVSLGQVFLSI